MPKKNEPDLSKENAGLRRQLLEQQELIAELRAGLKDLRAQLKESNAANSDLRKMIADLQSKLDILIAQMKKRNRRDFGDKTERHNPRPAPPAKDKRKQPNPESSSSHARHIFRHKNLPTRPVPHPVSVDQSVCPSCSVDTVFVRSELTYQLERLSHSLELLQHEQEIRSCPKCKQYVVMGEKPCQPIPGSYAGPGLLADIAVSKLADGMPNYRQEKRFKREDAVVPRSTQSDWMLKMAATVELLYEMEKREVLLSNIVQTDDSELKIQDKSHKKKMRKGKMTVYRGDRQHPYVVFEFSPTQSFKQNIDFFKEYAGIIQADAAPGFDALFKDGSKLEAACHAHSRRKYFEHVFLDPIRCNEILDIYHAIYQVEEKIRKASPAVRLATRRRQTKPLLKQLRSRVVALRDSLHPSSPPMTAAEYTLSNWIALTRFLKEPELDIDNNASEREIKDFVLDRKAFLFAGSNAGAKAIAILLSLIASAKRNKVDPRAYLTDVFARINSMKTSELPALLPDRWARDRNQTINS